MSSKNFKKIENPYVSGNPIKSKEMFFGRDRDFSKIKSWIKNDAHHVILLIGGRRSGKTSMLLQIKNGRLKNECEPVFCDFHQIVSKIQKDEDLPRLIGECVLKNISFKKFEASFHNGDDPYSARLQTLLTDCLHSIYPKKLVLLCDEFDTLETRFDEGILSRNSITWANGIFNESIFFIMTSSKQFRNNHIRNIFSNVSVVKSIDELNKKDAYALIQKPVANTLNYDEDSLKSIFRLSGGQPFYTQYICQTLIVDINYRLQRNNVFSKDLINVINSIVEDPPGHILETWRDISDPRKAPKHALHVLSALAASIKNKEDYIDHRSITKIAKERRFNFEDLQLKKSLAWFKGNTRLIEWDSNEKYRFKSDLLRHWIINTYLTGDDVDEYLNKNIKPNIEKYYKEKVTFFLKLLKNDQEISEVDRKELSQLRNKLDINEKQSIFLENEVRRELNLPTITIYDIHESDLYKKILLISISFLFVTFFSYLIYNLITKKPPIPKNLPHSQTSINIQPKKEVIWQDNFEVEHNKKTWEDANQYCENLRLDNLKWELPDRMDFKKYKQDFIYISIEGKYWAKKLKNSVKAGMYNENNNTTGNAKEDRKYTVRCISK